MAYGGVQVQLLAFISSTVFSHLTFVGPYIVIYFYSKTNQMHNISNLFYFGTTLYMSRTVFPFSDGLSVHHQESKTVHTASYHKQAATEPVWHIRDAVCTVLDSWWWTERPSETCTVLFQNKINLRYCASGWFYCRNNFLASWPLFFFSRDGTSKFRSEWGCLDPRADLNASELFLLPEGEPQFLGIPDIT